MKKHVWWYVSFSFIFGVTFGFFYETKAFKTITQLNPEPTRVLAPKNLLPEDLIESFKLENNNELHLTYYTNNEELNLKLGDGRSYDLILAPHTLIPELKSKGIIAPIDPRLLRNIKNISADFRDLPTDPGGTYSIPLVWGVTALRHGVTNTGWFQGFIASSTFGHDFFNKEIVRANIKPAKGFYRDNINHRQTPALWIQSFAIPSHTENARNAYAMIDFFLSADIAVELSNITKNAGTNIALENAKLEARLKPSHLRSQKFAEIIRAKE